MKKPKKRKLQRVDDQQLQEIVGKIIEADEGGRSELIADLKELKKSELVEMVAITASQSVMHSGPLPPAAELVGYEEACVGAADRIIQMAEKEQGFRHIEIPKSEQRAFADRKIGYFLGAFLLVTLIIGSVFCAYIGEVKLAYALLGTGVLSIVAKYVPSAIQFLRSKKEE